MIAIFKPSRLFGTLYAPPSKSLTHRFLIGAALSGEKCTWTNVDYSEDILATIDCLRALGGNVTADGDRVTVDPRGFMQVKNPILNCRESGSTLRFFLPLALCLGYPTVLRGSTRLLERPLDVYKELCTENGFTFQKGSNAVTVCGKLAGGHYTVRGDISSQFITGLLFALVYLNEPSTIRILPPFESRPYVDLTVSALKAFGADIQFCENDTISVRGSRLHGFSGKAEGDYSNAAFLDVFNYLGSAVNIENLNKESLQGDRVYPEYFEQLAKGSPELDISDHPDLGPVLFALAALKHGASFTGTSRLKMKETDRRIAMRQELEKLGGKLIIGDNSITVPKQSLRYKGTVLSGHNDHRIVMALSVILVTIGGDIDGVEAVRKSYPGFFDDLMTLGADIEFV